MSNNPDCLRFLASFLAARNIGISIAPAGQPSYTDGQMIFVSAKAPIAAQRREVLVQSALLGAGSLEPVWIKALRGRPQLARRYLVLEGYRVLAALTTEIPLAATLLPDIKLVSHSAEQSLGFAKSRVPLTEPPLHFGVIRPSRLLATDTTRGSRATNQDLRLEFDEIDIAEADNEGDEEQREASKILKLFENPLFNSQALSDYFRKLLGGSRAAGEGEAGTEMQTRSLRRSKQASNNARPLPTRIQFTDRANTGAVLAVMGSLHPEWDVHNQRYRPDWCRVIEIPLSNAVAMSAAGVRRDAVLHNRLARLGLGPKVLRRRPEGEDLDVETLTDLFVDLNAGYSPPEHIYLERRKLARDLGVLILVDASGSSNDIDEHGDSVHEHQRRAAATLAATLEELGDRVAVYGFRSQGRDQIHLLALKPFSQRFGAGARARLNQLEPSGYTRLGAGIRGAGEILKRDSGTPNRLLLVLSDGFPYDDGYEHHYAESDARKALEELRHDGVACLCLSVGATSSEAALDRVFGSTSHSSAQHLGQLSPQMDELFLSALRELSVANPHAIQ